MRERVVTFGADQSLVGILTVPDGDTPSTAIVMANIGLNHRPGPFRLNVELARRMACRGMAAFRFDGAGLGDSLASVGALGVTASSVRGMTEALDTLQARLGIDRFILVGLCSGVDTVHPVATVDPRVVGAVFIDGYTYPTPRSIWRRYVLWTLIRERWVRYFRRWRHLARTARSTPAATPTVFSRVYPPIAAFRSDVARMVERGAALLFVWSGSYRDFNAPRQLFEMLGSRGRPAGITVEYLRGADHLFTALAHRRELLELIEGWALSLPVRAAPTGARSSTPKPASGR